MDGPGRRDYGWAALSIVTVVLFLGAVFDALWGVVHEGSWWRLAGMPVAGLFSWWWGMGAWRRTIWGRPPAPI